MLLKFLRTTLCTVLLLGTTHALVVQASAGGQGDSAPSQSPVQVVVQIVLTAIVLRILGRFDLP
ncbi:MAG: hypothetical protein IGS48_17710 [Oscillatoriales cyanobacterium C42_A2020_001]|nr:hypothetical protein [Leptolyngbyaceae cyanobacterium C42_A2020_001]